MTANTIRRLAVAGIAAAGVAAAAAPSASADSLLVRTQVSVPAPYDQTAFSPQSRSIDEAKGPVLLRVRHTIQCLRGKERRPGYGPRCQWSSSMFGLDAEMGPRQGIGDFYAASTPTYPQQGTTFHAGTLAEGATTVDDWNVIVRGDSLLENDERFRMTVSASAGGTLARTFTILDDERRR